jgi:hypothetical protein
MASDGIEKEQEMKRDKRNCFGGRDWATLPDMDSERQPDCTNLRLCWDWATQRDIWQHWARRDDCTWLMGWESLSDTYLAD